MKALESISKIVLLFIAFIHFFGIMWFLSYAGVIDRIVATGFITSAILVVIFCSIPIKDKSYALTIITLSIVGIVSLIIQQLVAIFDNNFTYDSALFYSFGIGCYLYLSHTPYLMLSRKLQYDT
jgi:hypothetical protein